MAEMDLEACRELVEEMIFEEGQKVYDLYWDSGGSGAGADSEVVYKFRDRYWTYSLVDEGFSGPFDTLAQALEGDFLYVTEATEIITCEELTAAQLAKKLTYFGEPGHILEINGEEWKAGRDGRFRKVRTAGLGREHRPLEPDEEGY
jgi:hypothetical protein